MKTLELLLISISLAMDAFSVSICKGLNLKYKFKRNCFFIALSFSFFQMLMPFIGYLLGSFFSQKLIKFNYIIAFLLLTTIGINMIKESYQESDIKIGLSIKELLFLSIATSIDAMAVGIAFSFFRVNLLIAILTIGIVCFLFSYLGVRLGKLIGKKFNMEILGGIILILIGLKILFEHLLF